MARSSDKTHSIKRLTASVLATAVLSGCAGWAPSDPDAGAVLVEKDVRTPARQDSAGVQVFPLQNPAVQELLADAGSAESAGDYSRAAVLLERALRIEPRDPEILQNMAEVQLQTGDYEQALNFAVRSYDSGPRVGEICSRNWRTIGVARRELGDPSGSAEAIRRASSCMSGPPDRF